MMIDAQYYLPSLIEAQYFIPPLIAFGTLYFASRFSVRVLKRLVGGRNSATDLSEKEEISSDPIGPKND